MKRIARWFVFFEIVGIVVLALGLWQPFHPVQMIGTVQHSTDLYIQLDTPRGSLFYPPPPFFVAVGTQVLMSCNVGEIIPVVFDCVNEVFPVPSRPTITVEG